MSWKISIQGTEYEAKDVDELKEWYRLGRIPRDAYVFHPVLERWMYPNELEELRNLSPQQFPTTGSPQPPKSVSILNTRVSGCSSCLILLFVLFGVGFLLVLFIGGSSSNSRGTRSSTPKQPARVWTSSDDPGSLPATGPIRNLHTLTKVTTVGKKRLIERWKWERGSAYVWFDLGVWNSLSASQQRQLVDQIANSTFMDGLINMWLYVGATEVGRIKPRVSGGFEFVPAGR